MDFSPDFDLEQGVHPGLRFIFSAALGFGFSFCISYLKYSKLKYKASKSKYKALRRLSKTIDFVVAPAEALLFQAGVYHSLDELGYKISVSSEVYIRDSLIPVTGGFTIGGVTGFKAHYWIHKKRWDEEAVKERAKLAAEEQVRLKYQASYQNQSLSDKFVKQN